MTKRQAVSDAPSELFSADIEKALAGSVLINPELLDDPRVAQVKPGQFHVHRLGWVWKAATTLKAQGKAIDLLTPAPPWDRPSAPRV